MATGNDNGQLGEWRSFLSYVIRIIYTSSCGRVYAVTEWYLAEGPVLRPMGFLAQVNFTPAVNQQAIQMTFFYAIFHPYNNQCNKNYKNALVEPITVTFERLTSTLFLHTGVIYIDKDE